MKKMNKIYFFVILAVLAMFIGCTIPTSYVHTYKRVKYAELDSYLEKITEGRVHYINVTGVTAADLKGDAVAGNCSPLGEKIKNASSKLVGIKIPKKIKGLTSMEACFLGCENVVDLANIPKGVTDISHCFEDDVVLRELPPMPKSIENMDSCFSGCVGLIKGQAIPKNVKNLKSCFANCYSLKSVKFNCPIPGDATLYQYIFEECNSLKEKTIKVQAGDLAKCQEELTLQLMFAFNPGSSKYASQVEAAKTYFTVK